MTFSGSYVAIVTPWNNDATAIDFGALKDLIEFHVAAGTDGIVPAGTTGESATLTHQEQNELVRRAVEMAAGRVKVVAGAGSNSTAESVALAKAAKASGADGLLVITPYYNRPTPEGLVRHFRAVGEATDLPIMAYNVPSRTGTNLLPPTAARIRKEAPTVVCVKEASGSVDQTSQILEMCDLEVMSGDDSLTLPLMAVGAKGVVSVAANVMPAEVKRMVSAALAGDFAAAREWHYKLLPLMKAVFFETNPIPSKTALRMMGRGNGVLRLPMCPMLPENESKLREVLASYGLIR